VGAGAGATVGNLFGPERCMKSGIGSSCITGGGGLKVGALIAVNAFGRFSTRRPERKLPGREKALEAWSLPTRCRKC